MNEQEEERQLKYVYGVLTVLDNKPIMQMLVSDARLTGRDVLDRVILTEDERKKYITWQDEKAIVNDLNKKIPIKVEIQEMEIS
jgi:ATP-dependent phosphoenolpyruvate carboxykinase